MRVEGRDYRSVWLDGATVRLINQDVLPHRFEILGCPTFQDTAEAIRSMAVRGAGAIGVAAGFAVAQAALTASDPRLAHAVDEAARLIRATRPTARDLFYAVEQVLTAVQTAGSPSAARQAAVTTANRLSDENAEAGRRIGESGEPLIPDGARILTHCNAGWLAFADWGSALAPIYLAHRKGKRPSVYVDETRPRSQGARLTAWELGQEGVAHTIIADAAAGSLFAKRAIDVVIVGADRIAANGDVANKIGTYTLALLARHHDVPFYIAAPRSTFDLATPNGSAVVIEERGEDEVLWVSGRAPDGSVQRVRISPENTHARNPAFDVTPAEWVTAFLTEGGRLAPNPEAIAAFVQPIPSSVAGRPHG